MPYDLGDSVPLSVEIRDATGTLVNAATVALTVTLPDGTTASPAPANTSTGVYTVTYVPMVAGRHTARWVATGPNAAYTDAFDVRESAPPLIVSLADVKAQLNITSTRSDEELRGFVEAATGIVESYVGAVIPRTFTDTVLATGGMLVLPHPPVLSVTSVTPETGTVLDPATYTVDLAAGVVRVPGTWSTLRGRYTVVYRAGRPVVPAEIGSAARIIVQHLWRTQNAGAALPPLGGEEVDAAAFGLGFAVPNRARELLAPHRMMVVG